MAGLSDEDKPLKITMGRMSHLWEESGHGWSAKVEWQDGERNVLSCEETLPWAPDHETGPHDSGPAFGEYLDSLGLEETEIRFDFEEEQDG